MVEALIILGLFTVAVVAGVPVVAGLSLAAFLGLWLFVEVPLDIVAQRVVAQVSSPVLVAVPLFILMAILLVAGGVTEKLFLLAGAVVGHFRGGLAQVNVVTSIFMGGLSGSSSADAAMQSRSVIPEMKKRNYPDGFSGAVTAASSTLAIVFPPSIAMLIYASLSTASVGKLFVAGILPGLLISAGFIATVGWASRRRKLGDKFVRSSHYFRNVARAGFEASPALLLPLVIIGGIRLGIFTPTEAGAVGCLVAFILGSLVYRKLKIRAFPSILAETAVLTGVVMLIVGAAAPLSWYLSVERIPTQIAAGLIDLVHPASFMVAAVLFIALAGMLLDATALLIMVTPLLAPIAASLGIDPVIFALVVILSIVVGNISPPLGQMVFIVSGVAKIPSEAIYKEVLIFVPTILAAIGFVILFPSPILALVDWFGP